MLAEQILSTLRFFDLQNMPLTAFEVHKFLIGVAPAAPDEVTVALQGMAGQGRIGQALGFYSLTGRQALIKQRLRNYLSGLPRERLINQYAAGFRHLPFIRAVALAGSQALGEHKPGSDIDLLVITDERFMWTARVFITAYLQILGLRRHGLRIANRFCLNHYVAGPKPITDSKNFYTAMEYLKLRPLVCPEIVRAFQDKNLSWITELFPNAGQHLVEPAPWPKSVFQKGLESILGNSFGRFLERQLGELQFKRIRINKDILVHPDELSFHPNSKAEILGSFTPPSS